MSLLGTYMNQKRGDARPPETRPLNLREGALVDIDQSPFLLLPEDAKVRHPGVGAHVQRVTHFGLLGMEVTRYHLAPPPATTDAPVCILQVTKDSKGEDLVVLTEAYEVFPESVEEVTLWLAESSGLLGIDLIRTPDEIEFLRVWGKAGELWKAPEQVVEDGAGHRVRRKIALYSRKVGVPNYVRFLDGASACLDQAKQAGADVTKVKEALAAMLPQGDAPEELMFVEHEDPGGRVVFLAGLQIPAAAIRVL